METTSTSSLPPLQYLVAYFLPVLLIGVFIGALASPRAMCDAALFPQPADKPLNIFFYLFAVRELVLGSALLILEATNEWRGVTILLGCIGLNGVSDFFIAGSMGSGWLASFRAHGIPTIMGYYSVWKLWEEHWA